MAIIFQDTFTDVNGTLLENHTPEVGGSWVDGSVAGHKYHINNNVVQVAFMESPRDYYYLVPAIPGQGISNGYVQIDTTGADGFGLLFRHTSITQHYLLVLQSGQGSFILYKKVSNTDPTGALTLPDYRIIKSGSNTAPRTSIKIIFQDTVISVYNSGALVFSVQDTTYATGGVGIHTRFSPMSIDNLIAESGNFLPSVPSVSIGSSGSGAAGRSGSYDFNRRINNDGTW